jgi:hypothetical protein
VYNVNNKKKNNQGVCREKCVCIILREVLFFLKMRGEKEQKNNPVRLLVFFDYDKGRYPQVKDFNFVSFF